MAQPLPLPVQCITGCAPAVVVPYSTESNEQVQLSLLIHTIQKIQPSLVHAARHSVLDERVSDTLQAHMGSHMKQRQTGRLIPGRSTVAREHQYSSKRSEENNYIRCYPDLLSRQSASLNDQRRPSMPWLSGRKQMPCITRLVSSRGPA